jgi:hypothetical protein
MAVRWGTRAFGLPGLLLVSRGFNLPGRDEQRLRTPERVQMSTDVPQTARMQALLREVNQNIRSVSDTFVPPATIQLLCECGNGCSSV